MGTLEGMGSIVYGLLAPMEHDASKPEWSPHLPDIDLILHSTWQLQSHNSLTALWAAERTAARTPTEEDHDTTLPAGCTPLLYS